MRHAPHQSHVIQLTTCVQSTQVEMLLHGLQPEQSGPSQHLKVLIDKHKFGNNMLRTAAKLPRELAIG